MNYFNRTYHLLRQSVSSVLNPISRHQNILSSNQVSSSVNFNLSRRYFRPIIQQTRNISTLIPSKNANDITQLLDEAKGLVGNGQLLEAEKSLKKIIDRYPNCKEAYHKLIQVMITRSPYSLYGSEIKHYASLYEKNCKTSSAVKLPQAVLPSVTITEEAKPSSNIATRTTSSSASPIAVPTLRYSI